MKVIFNKAWGKMWVSCINALLQWIWTFPFSVHGYVDVQDEGAAGGYGNSLGYAKLIKIASWTWKLLLPSLLREKLDIQQT